MSARQNIHAVILYTQTNIPFSIHVSTFYIAEERLHTNTNLSGTITSGRLLCLNLNRVRMEEGDSISGLPTLNSLTKSSSRCSSWNSGSSLACRGEKDMLEPCVILSEDMNFGGW